MTCKNQLVAGLVAFDEKKADGARQAWMGLLARSDGAFLNACVCALGELPAHVLLRGPEQGLVMVRGRTGAIGAPFNLGEMTVTRCSVRLADGTVGHAYVQGRDSEKARNAAVLDAMLQQPETGPRVHASVIAPLMREETERRELSARKAAATRVDFFTMVRSEHGGRD